MSSPVYIDSTIKTFFDQVDMDLFESYKELDNNKLIGLDVKINRFFRGISGTLSLFQWGQLEELQSRINSLRKKNEKERLENFINIIDTSPQEAKKPDSIRFLEECAECTKYSRTSSLNPRKKIEESIVCNANNKLQKSHTITYISLGSGDLLQDWIILGKLIQNGFTKFNVISIDECFGIESKNFADLVFKQRLASKERLQKEQFSRSLHALGATYLQTNYFDNLNAAITYMSDFSEETSVKADILVGIDLFQGSCGREFFTLKKDFLASDRFCIKAFEGVNEIQFSPAAYPSKQIRKNMEEDAIENLFEKCSI